MTAGLNKTFHRVLHMNITVTVPWHSVTTTGRIAMMT